MVKKYRHVGGTKQMCGVPLTFTDSITWVERGKADAEPIYEGKHTMWVTALVTHVWLSVFI